MFINIFDDASLWIRRPPGWIEPEVRNRLPKVTSKKKKEGRSVHATVLNLQETLVFVPMLALQEAWRGVDIISPATCLPAANYGTVLDRWRRWWQ